MARDAISRQYDVDKNSMTLTCEPGKGSYLAGLIAFQAKKGKSIDLDKIRASLMATRLSGGTNMRVEYLEISANGAAETQGKELLFTVSGTGQVFVLGENPATKAMLQKLREAVERGEKVTMVSGRVSGWTGRFPDVLRALGNATAMPQLLVTDFQTVK
jgi:hypothetical protein